jgi:hypothetical protein
MRMATPSPSEKSTSATASGSARRRSTRGLLGLQEPAEPFALAAQELRELGSDLLVATRQREQLEDQRHEAGVVADHVVEARDEPGDEVVDRARVGELGVEQLQAHVALAPHDLHEQPLLRAEVVVQQPARDAGRARDLVERRARRPALAHRGAHRVDDARRLVAGQLAPAAGRPLHAGSVLAGRPATACEAGIGRRRARPLGNDEGRPAERPRLRPAGDLRLS